MERVGIQHAKTKWRKRQKKKRKKEAWVYNMLKQSGENDRIKK